ncbi:MAG: TlpA family protein disulfide reductase, partial [Candidatus Hydrogenedentes bacterium]|nr:TlpA family protein disulfide reductase [Candidatus Hydrogenedentota bacterium]
LIKAAKGKVVVVNFWATWCPPCVHEMPDLLKFYEANKEKSVQFLSISADGPGAIDDRVRPFMTEKKLSFPVYALDVGSPDEIAEALKIDFEGTLPATLVYDSAGKLAKFWNEEITLAQLTNTVYPLRPAE